MHVQLKTAPQESYLAGFQSPCSSAGAFACLLTSDRTAGGHCHYRNPRRHAVAGPLLAKFKAKVTGELHLLNYRQWGVAVNMYALDNGGKFPSFDDGSLNNTWDLCPSMIFGLQPYGLTVPMWYCPVRPNDFSGPLAGPLSATVAGGDDTWCRAFYGHPLGNLNDLWSAVIRVFSGTTNTASLQFELGVCYHSWWVPRRGWCRPLSQHNDLRPDPVLANKAVDA